MKKNKELSDKIALENWERYQYARLSGHDNYILNAKKLENFYLGGGRQWSKKDRMAVEGSGRPCIEINTIFPAINTAIGEQLKSRFDISYKPRNSGSDEQVAEIITKVAKQVCDDISYRWLESQVFSDGIIQQRGYFDFTINFDKNALGVIACEALDPVDVIPDPDANSYDPESWADVIIVRWWTLDRIRQLFGDKIADEVENRNFYATNPIEKLDRNSFNDYNNLSGAYWVQGGTVRYLVIDRQHRVSELTDVLISQDGKIEIADMYQDDEKERMLSMGYIPSKRVINRIRWTLSTNNVTLHDDWSPYKTFTVIPYFPYFRRGKTVGMVDNAISPQELLNKTTSQMLHIVNTTANSGWIVEDNSLVNMRPDDLEDQGAKTGIVLVHRKGSNPPSKINPNQIPTGLDRIADKSEFFIKVITGMNDAQQGLNGNEISGIAIQSKQYQGKTQLAGIIDNLNRTRHLVGKKILELIQDFYTEERIFMITDNADPSNITYKPLVINKMLPNGDVENRINVGDYDVVITDVPATDTFENNQFNQALEMRRLGIGIPDSYIIETSSLSKKNEIVKSLTERQDPLLEAKIREIEANINKTNIMADKIKTDKVSKAVEAQYSAMQAANVAASMPQTARIADSLLRSAGFQDNDSPPIVPQDNIQQGQEVNLQEQNIDMDQIINLVKELSGNNNPITPKNPDVGLKAGIETPENDMVEKNKEERSS